MRYAEIVRCPRKAKAKSNPKSKAGDVPTGIKLFGLTPEDMAKTKAS